MKLNLLFCILSVVFISCQNLTDSLKENTSHHPSLILTAKDVINIKSNLGKVPLFDKTLAEVKTHINAEIEKPIIVPIPKDMAGGYTHSQHKANYSNMQKAGVLFQLLDDEKYAIYIRDMLLEYAKLYPSLGRHPETRSYARGKFFWQCLNDANWLVYTSQAYDCIYDWLPQEERNYLNTNLFKPYADFLSSETPQYFNRIHNHSTWGNAAVGMIGLVLEDDLLINRALYGLKNDNIEPSAKDNDGGFIKNEQGKAGFFANLDSPFSPDGFYTEGPYYQRYAMYPFLIFAQALQNKRPELKIFEYREGVLLKAVSALLNLTDKGGDFFPLNDAQKGMSYYTPSLVSAVNIAYYYGTKDNSLLSIVKKQDRVCLDAAGLAAAMSLRDEKEKPFIKKSVELRDGSNGDEGAVGIIRHNNQKETMALVMKYTGQGLSHGHYDKLSFSMYENGEEIIQDYGLSRFVNVEQKNGGGYLKENKTFAKHTIAHNTITQNEQSHFNYNYVIGSKNHSERYLFDISDTNFQIVSAKEENAYPGSGLHRTMILVKEAELLKPYVIDIFNITSLNTNQYDLPFYYFGQIINSSFKTKTFEKLSVLGNNNGYQHLWKVAEGKANAKNIQFTWLNKNRFYSITSATNVNDKVLLVNIGANDPQFNLRNEPALILRKNNTKNTVFASAIESHGTYNPVTEKANNTRSIITKIKVLESSKQYTVVKLEYTSKKKRLLILANTDSSKNKQHTLKINNNNYQWKGAYYFK